MDFKAIRKAMAAQDWAISDQESAGDTEVWMGHGNAAVCLTPEHNHLTVHRQSPDFHASLTGDGITTDLAQSVIKAAQR